MSKAELGRPGQSVVRSIVAHGSYLLTDSPISWQPTTKAIVLAFPGVELPRNSLSYAYIWRLAVASARRFAPST